MRRIGMVLAAGAAVVAAAACSRPAPAHSDYALDDALRADLAAAQAAVERPSERTQFVSALELGRVAAPSAVASSAEAPVAAPRPARSAPARVAVARRAAPSSERVVRPAARVRTPDPAPLDEPTGDVAAAPSAAPSPRVEPAPAPAPDEPVVAVPSRRPDIPSLPPPRRGRVWDMGDVIRNAPFPINP